jgi:hypothetical protein
VTFAYPRARWIVGALATDVLLGVALLLFALRNDGPLAHAMLIAIPLVLSWGVVTLHHPRSVSIDDEAITFSAYGRRHRFAWSEVEQLRVRRFLVRDRVLVRISPASPWRGRYWILDGIEGFPTLVAELESRSVSPCAESRRADLNRSTRS